MRLTHFGHSCLLVEIADTRILFDPGTFSRGFDDLRDLDAIFVTHQHPDHADPARLPDLVAANPGAVLRCDPQTAEQLGGSWTAARPGDGFAVGAVHVTIAGGRHAVIHPDLPVVDNAVFQLGTESDPLQFVHPGDSLVVPDGPVGVLAAPAAAPWMKIAEAIDYLRAVAPRVAIPIHQAIIDEAARGIFYGHLANFAPDGTQFRILEAGTATDVA